MPKKKTKKKDFMSQLDFWDLTQAVLEAHHVPYAPQAWGKLNWNLDILDDEVGMFYDTHTWIHA